MSLSDAASVSGSMLALCVVPRVCNMLNVELGSLWLLLLVAALGASERVWSGVWWTWRGVGSNNACAAAPPQIVVGPQAAAGKRVRHACVQRPHTRATARGGQCEAKAMCEWLVVHAAKALGGTVHLATVWVTAAHSHAGTAVDCHAGTCMLLAGTMTPFNHIITVGA